MQTRVPGKMFLLGEYAALAGGKAWVAAVSPDFVAESDGLKTTTDSESCFPHPQSPAGRWLSGNHKRELWNSLCIKWSDPWKGAGGFGGSTAEWIVAHRFCGGVTDTKEIWEEYRSFHEGSRVPPSGADLVVQNEGRSGWFEFSSHWLWEPVAANSFAGAHSVIYSAATTGKKVKTHEHLQHRDLLKVGAELSDLSAELCEDIRQNRWSSKPLSRWSSALQKLELEASHTFQARQVLSRLPQVLDAKGCGALLSDVLWVVLNDQPSMELQASLDQVLLPLGWERCKGAVLL